jgi:hypothetical protein
MRRIGIRVLVFLATILLPVGVVNAQGNQWLDDPGQLGHYAIGHTSYLLSDTARANRPVYLDVWYPVDARNITTSTAPAQYALDPFSKNLPVSSSKDWEILGYDPAYEGPTPADDGPFPLLMFSPGFDDDSWQQLFIGTRLASHGYVVAVLDHFADCQWAWSPCDDGWTIMYNRPRDVSFAVTTLVEMSKEPGQLLHHTIDHHRIGASGHSMGGYAAFTLAGGDNEVCDAMWGVLYNSGATFSLPPPPSTCAPSYPDPRVKVIIPLDGTQQLLHYRELARISVPSLIMGEPGDNWIGIFPDGNLKDSIARPHAAIDRPDSPRVDVTGANHYTFTNYCDGAQVFLNLGIITPDIYAAWISNWPCASTGPAPVTVSSANGHLAVTKYMIAFLDVYLARLDPDWWLDRWILTPEYALTHTPTVQFFDNEVCQAVLPDDTYFRYRPYQTSSECDVAQKDPTGWFASDPLSTSPDPTGANTRASKAQLLQPKKPF